MAKNARFGFTEILNIKTVKDNTIVLRNGNRYKYSIYPACLVFFVQGVQKWSFSVFLLKEG
jgi:hypothetical protein